MGIMDAFKPEDRTEITYSNFYKLIKQATQYEIVMNAVNCNVPHGYIRETMTGKKEEHKEEKPVHGTRKRQIEKVKRKGEKSNDKNEPEI